MSASDIQNEHRNRAQATSEGAHCSDGCVVLTTPSRGRATRWSAALAAQGIPYDVNHGEEYWTLKVPAEYADAARRELDLYEHVNRDFPPAGNIKTHASRGTGQHGLFSSLMLACALLAWYMRLGPARSHSTVHALGAADSNAITSGEWWRAVTALTLHADFTHAFTNAACLVLFGSAVCRLTGAGTGWLLVLASGTLANLAGSYLTSSPTSAIGASTAVFGALGLVTVFQFVAHLGNWRELRTVWHRGWVILLGALALLALLGTAPGTDVAGHLLGFLAGCALGGLALPLARQKLPALLQTLLFGCVVLTVLLAWHLAFLENA